MARSKKADQALIMLLVVVGLPIWLFQNYPLVAFALLALAVAGLIAYVRSRNCELCGVQLKRAVYEWQIDGERKRLCPNCNRGLEKRQSARALTNF
jgi:hypothetical protein